MEKREGGGVSGNIQNHLMLQKQGEEGMGDRGNW